MMISKAQISQVLKVYETQKNMKPGAVKKGKPSGSPKDDVALSFQREDIEKVSDMVKKLPDIRDEIVAPLAKAVSSSEYSRDSKKVAEKLIGRLLADKIR